MRPMVWAGMVMLGMLCCPLTRPALAQAGPVVVTRSLRGGPALASGVPSMPTGPSAEELARRCGNGDIAACTARQVLIHGSSQFPSQAPPRLAGQTH